MSENEKTPQWYVVHTYSGYENKVKQSLEQTVKNTPSLQAYIKEVFIPIEEVVEVQEGKRKVVQRKIFPGYVLVKMILDNQAWYTVRNTRGVTGFVGPGSHPVPLSESEVEFMLNRTEVSIDIALGDEVRVLSGPFENHIGKVKDIDTLHQKVKVLLSMFNRETTVELDYDQVIRFKDA